MMTSFVRTHTVITLFGRLASFEEMEAEGLERLRASFDGPVRTVRSVDMRYGEQVFEIAVPLDGLDWGAADPLLQIRRSRYRGRIGRAG